MTHLLLLILLHRNMLNINVQYVSGTTPTMSLDINDNTFDEQQETPTLGNDVKSDNSSSEGNSSALLNMPITIVKRETDAEYTEHVMLIKGKAIIGNVIATTLNSPSELPVPVTKIKNETSTEYIEPVKLINDNCADDIKFTSTNDSCHQTIEQSYTRTW